MVGVAFGGLGVGVDSCVIVDVSVSDSGYCCGCDSVWGVACSWFVTADGVWTSLN